MVHQVPSKVPFIVPSTDELRFPSYLLISHSLYISASVLEPSVIFTPVIWIVWSFELSKLRARNFRFFFSFVSRIWAVFRSLMWATGPNSFNRLSMFLKFYHLLFIAFYVRALWFGLVFKQRQVIYIFGIREIVVLFEQR